MEIDNIVAKELMAPLDANKAANLTRQIKRSLLCPMADDLKPEIFHTDIESKRNVGTAKA
jgi:hypothetical protein